MAAVSVVLPWSMWPIVPTLICGFDRSNFFFAMWLLPLSCGSGGRTRTADPSIMSRVLLPTELRRLAGVVYPEKSRDFQLTSRPPPLSAGRTADVRAPCRNRTDDTSLTMAVLYRLS